MPEKASRISLVAAGVAVMLGIVAVIAHLRQPVIPLLPGKGCLTTRYQSPDSRFIPVPYVEFEACIHISETIFTLWYHGPENTGSQVFTATGPEGPAQWAEHFRIAWAGPNVVEVTYDQSIHMESKPEKVGDLTLRYTRSAGR